MLTWINFFLFASLLVLLIDPKNMHPMLLSSSCEAKLFEFHSLPSGHLTFLGDSHIQNSDIALTNESMSTNGPKSAGVVLYKHPILFLDRRSKMVPSFRTMFAFWIQSIYEDKEAFGDGLAFLISPTDRLIGSPGYFGLVNSTDLTRNKFIAIEFDTKRDPMFQDPDDNHVGLDINSLFSVKLATSSSLGVNLKSGALISTWIDYECNEKRLEVFLSDSYTKPKSPLLQVDIDLADYLKENMFVGFSAATEGSVQLTRITQWEFTIMEFSPPPPPSTSPPESASTFPNPSHRQSHLTRFVIGLIVGACSVPFMLFFCWVCWKKLMGMLQKSEGTNSLEMQPTRASGGMSCQEILFYILVEEIARGLSIEKELDNEVNEAVKTVKSSIPLCNCSPAMKPSVVPICNGLPLRTNDVSSV